MASSTPSTRSRFFGPTLSTMIALIALVVALATNADALPGVGTVQTNDIKNGAVKTPKIANGAVKTSKVANGAITAAKIKGNAMWALVDGAGTVLQSSGVSSVSVLDTGFYSIVFQKPVTDRALAATVYNNSAGNGQVNVRYCDPASPGYVSCFGADGPTRAMVNTEDSSGANAANAFLVVAMPATASVSVARASRPSQRGSAEGQ